MLARAFVIVGGLVVLVLLAALVVPLFVDWTSYRADFEREASAILGRKVTVAGKASARLIPFPSVTFTDVKEIKPADLKRWLKKAAAIQWDYKNIVKRKGELVRLK